MPSLFLHITIIIITERLSLNTLAKWDNQNIPEKIKNAKYFYVHQNLCQLTSTLSLLFLLLL